MRIEALKLARQIALSSLRSKVPALCLPCVCECAQPGEQSAACPGAPWGDTSSMLAAELAQKCSHPTHTPINNRREAAAFLQQEMDFSAVSVAMVCCFSEERFVLKYLMVKNTRPSFGHKDILSSAGIFSLKSCTFDPQCLEVRNSVKLALRHLKKGTATGLEGLQSSQGKKASQHNVSLFIKI